METGNMKKKPICDGSRVGWMKWKITLCVSSILIVPRNIKEKNFKVIKGSFGS